MTIDETMETKETGEAAEVNGINLYYEPTEWVDP